MLDEQRVMWLIGGGSGLPLPLAFSTVVEEIIDHDFASTEQLVKAVSGALAFKEDRVLASPFRTWGGFTEGVVRQLESIGVVQNLGGWWFTGEQFEAGTRIVAIPSTDVWFTVREKGERERLDRAERMLMDTRVILAEFQRFSRYPQEEGTRALEKLRQAERLTVEAEQILLGVRPYPGAGMPPQQPRGLLEGRPTAVELAAEKYGLGGGTPGRSTVVSFGPDGKRPCSQCHHSRRPEDFDVYTDGRGKNWFLRGVCRGCLAGNRAAVKAEKKRLDAERRSHGS